MRAHPSNSILGAPVIRMELDTSPSVSEEPQEVANNSGRFNLGVSNALLLYRVANGALIFSLPLVVGVWCSGVLEHPLNLTWAAYTLASHIVTLLTAIVSTKQHKRALLRVAVAAHLLWVVMSVALSIYFGVVGSRIGADDSKGFTARITVPASTLVALLHALAFISGFQILKEPVRPLASTYSTDSAYEGTYHFATSQAEETELDDLEDGLGTSELYVSPSTPTGLARRLPLLLQILSITQCIYWPFFFLGIILALVNSKSALLVAVSVAYHYSMLIWAIGSTVVSFGFRNKPRLFVASLAGFGYLLFCIAMLAVKASLLTFDDTLGLVEIGIHLFLLVPWCAAAYYIGISYFDYSNVPVCCG